MGSTPAMIGTGTMLLAACAPATPSGSVVSLTSIDGQQSLPGITATVGNAYDFRPSLTCASAWLS